MSSLKSFKLSQLAEILGAELEGDPSKEIIGINTLEASLDLLKLLEPLAASWSFLELLMLLGSLEVRGARDGGGVEEVRRDF